MANSIRTDDISYDNFQRSNRSQESQMKCSKRLKVQKLLRKGTTEIRNTVNHGIQFRNLNAEGAKHFAQVLKYDNSLKWVNLYENRVCDRGAKDLAEMLKVNGSLKKMNLFGNNISAEGAKWLAEALTVNCSLEYINLGCNNIGDKGAKYLANMLKWNKSLKEINLLKNK